MSKISEKFYGTANRWNDIYQANRDILSSARSLRVGQELLIPRESLLCRLLRHGFPNLEILIFVI